MDRLIELQQLNLLYTNGNTCHNDSKTALQHKFPWSHVFSTITSRMLERLCLNGIENKYLPRYFWEIFP